MTDGHVDWQVVLYGGVVHAFTDKVHLQNAEHGIKYDAVADQRSSVEIPEAWIFPVRELLPTEEVRALQGGIMSWPGWGSVGAG